MKTATSFDELLWQLRARFVPFLAAFFAVIFFTYLVLYIVDFYPEPKTDTPAEATTSVASSTPSQTQPVVSNNTTPVVATPATTVVEKPVSITFDSLNRTVTVLNPTSNVSADLDTALLSGVVHHPQSADLGETGNVFLLGHSSYLPTVFNKNFQAFNDIQKLSWGDIIRIDSADKEYVYRVDRVYKAKASDVVVPTNVSGNLLTLATCNVFAAKEDRYILEATLIETNNL